MGWLPPAGASAPRFDRGDDEVRGLPGQIVLDVLDRAQEPVADDFGGLSGVVRREHHARQGQERVAGLDRLIVEDVEAGAGELVLREGIQERLPLDQRAAAGVDQDRRRLHHRELAPAQEAARLGRQAQVERHDIRAAQDVFLRGGAGAQLGDGGGVLAVAEDAERFPDQLVRRSRGQPPPRTSRSMRGIRRAAASMSASACSATANALTPGVLQTVIPWRPAASRSMLSVPVPQIEIISSFRHASITRSVKRACARMLMATRAVSIRLMSSASSSAPRAVKTFVSPTLRQRSWAGVFSKTDGKSSGTQIVMADLASALIPPRRRTSPAPRPRRRRARTCGRGRAGSARAPRGSAARSAGWRSWPWCRSEAWWCASCRDRCR